jgi:TRAP-type C4-dicarboxylate transport system substrate-binding protein
MSTQKKGFLVLIALALLATPLFSSSAKAGPGPAKPILLRFGWYPGPLDPQTKVFMKYAEEVGKRTGGKVKIDCYPAEALCKAPATYEAIRTGVQQMGLFLPSYTPGIFPLSAGLDLHGWDMKDTLMASRIYSSIIDKCSLHDEYKGVKLLFVYSSPPTRIETSKKPVRSLKDLAGLQIRCPGGKVSAMKALGAVPVSMPLPECLLALEKGIVDGTLLSYQSVRTWNLAGVIRYVTASPGAGTAMLVGMNRGVWDSLPADVKGVFEELAVYGQEGIAKSWDHEDKITLEWFPSAGIELISLSPEEKARWIERLMPVHQAWIKDMEAKGYPAKALCDAMAEAIKNYTK